jgi:hypothetical protein
MCADQADLATECRSGPDVADRLIYDRVPFCPSYFPYAYLAVLGVSGLFGRIGRFWLIWPSSVYLVHVVVGGLSSTPLQACRAYMGLILRVCDFNLLK